MYNTENSFMMCVTYLLNSTQRCGFTRYKGKPMRTVKKKSQEGRAAT